MTTKNREPNSVVFLHGRKTTLRPPEESDIPMFVRWINDPAVRVYLRNIFPINEIAEKRWLEKVTGQNSKVVLVIQTLKHTPIGVIGFHEIDHVNRTATTGTFIGEKKYWNQGYGTDAKLALLHYGFDTLNLRKIKSRAIALNKASIAYNVRCGYIEEGKLKEEVFCEGEYVDMIELAIFRQNWLPVWEHYQKTGKVPRPPRHH